MSRPRLVLPVVASVLLVLSCAGGDDATESGAGAAGTSAAGTSAKSGAGGTAGSGASAGTTPAGAGGTAAGQAGKAGESGGAGKAGDAGTGGAAGQGASAGTAGAGAGAQSCSPGTPCPDGYVCEATCFGIDCPSVCAKKVANCVDETCPEGTYCVSAVFVHQFYCMPKAAHGAPCDTHDTPENTQVCADPADHCGGPDPFQEVCTARVTVGEPCQDVFKQSPCLGGTCEGGVCTAYAKLGEPCQNAACATDLACEGTPGQRTCVKRRKLGEPCHTLSLSFGCMQSPCLQPDSNCEGYLVCSFEKAGACAVPADCKGPEKCCTSPSGPVCASGTGCAEVTGVCAVGM